MARREKGETKDKCAGVNSGAFYFGAASGDWTSPQNDALWRDGAKILFDPCPSGWRVPLGGEGEQSPWNQFTAANSTWNGEGINPAGGRLFSAAAVTGGTAWYPANGSRRSESGNVNFGGKYIYNWNTTVSGTTSYYVSASQSGVKPVNLIDYRSAAMPVRCVRL